MRTPQAIESDRRDARLEGETLTETVRRLAERATSCETVALVRGRRWRQLCANEKLGLESTLHDERRTEFAQVQRLGERTKLEIVGVARLSPPSETRHEVGEAP